jgi:hypothetical protein
MTLYLVALLVLGLMTSNAPLNGGIDASESLIAAAIPASQSGGRAPRADRLCDSSSCDSLLAPRSGADQQSHYQLDAANSFQRLESTTASLGCISLVANLRINRSVRRANCQRHDLLRERHAGLVSTNRQSMLLRRRRHDAIQPQVISNLPVVVGNMPYRNHGDAQLRIWPAVAAIHAVHRIFLVDRR